MKKEYPQIFRNTLKTAVKEDVSKDSKERQEKLFEFCEKEKIIGGGWPLYDGENEVESFHADRDTAYNLRKKYSGYGRGFTNCINRLDEMRPGDLVWTRCNGIYYLCPIVDSSKQITESDKPIWEYKSGQEDSDFNKFDMHLIANVADFIEVGTAQDVPGKIISSFASPSALQRISDDSHLLAKWSIKILNEKKKEGTLPYYDDFALTKSDEDNIFELLHPKDVEEVVCLYLQKELRYYVYTNTTRKDMETYECVMVKNDGNHRAYVQVKTGGVSLDGSNAKYAELAKDGNKVYLFTADDSKCSCTDGQKIIHVETEKIREFTKQNKHLLSEKIKHWLE